MLQAISQKEQKKGTSERRNKLGSKETTMKIKHTREPLVGVITLLDFNRDVEPGLDLVVVAHKEVLEEGVEASDDHQEETG